MCDGYLLAVPSIVTSGVTADVLGDLDDDDSELSEVLFSPAAGTPAHRYSEPKMAHSDGYSDSKPQQQSGG